jgi:hypothetical protein
VTNSPCLALFATDGSDAAYRTSSARSSAVNGRKLPCTHGSAWAGSTGVPGPATAGLGQGPADESRVKAHGRMGGMALALMGKTRVWLAGEVSEQRDLALMRRVTVELPYDPLRLPPPQTSRFEALAPGQLLTLDCSPSCSACPDGAQPRHAVRCAAAACCRGVRETPPARCAGRGHWRGARGGAKGVDHM